jgi:hypothetical protein
MALHKLKPSTEVLTQFQSCLKLLEADAQISRWLDILVGNGIVGGQTLDGAGTLLVVVEDFHLSGRALTTSEIDKFYMSVEDVLYADYIESKCSSRLFNFDSDASEIELGAAILRSRRS